MSPVKFNFRLCSAGSFAGIYVYYNSPSCQTLQVLKDNGPIMLKVCITCVVPLYKLFEILVYESPLSFPFQSSFLVCKRVQVDILTPHCSEGFLFQRVLSQNYSSICQEGQSVKKKLFNICLFFLVVLLIVWNNDSLAFCLLKVGISLIVYNQNIKKNHG